VQEDDILPVADMDGGVSLDDVALVQCIPDLGAVCTVQDTSRVAVPDGAFGAVTMNWMLFALNKRGVTYFSKTGAQKQL
jgi:hypothetical protein